MAVNRPESVWHAPSIKNQNLVNVTLFLKRHVQILKGYVLDVVEAKYITYMYVLLVLQRHVQRLKRYVLRMWISMRMRSTHMVSLEFCLVNMAAKKEVLVVYGDRRRPIVFEPCEDPKEERVRLLEAVKVAFSDLLEEEEGLYLQTKSDKWDGQMIDVVDSVCDGAILHLQQQLEATPDSKVDQ